ncbi:MAG: DUF4013 domain-containing protein [Ardenticatenaceae bacterium]|nr:DUF4013 domain-containing protein [Anaerolineales bacterium]MCB8919065.1 DUF4013 domain-containing protein [Ardenticatenaceae bacterium]
MDIARAFTFVMEDERWIVKVGMGAVVTLFSFLIFPIFLLLGYSVAVTRNVSQQKELPLPEWTEDIGKLFMDGFYVGVAQLAYTLPFWLITCIAVVATVGLGAAGSGSETAASVAAGVSTLTFVLLGCLSILFVIALFFLSPAIIVQYVRTNEFAACFRIAEVIAIARENMGPILIVALVSFGASFAISLVTGFLQIIPCIGTIIGLVIGVMAGPYLSMSIGHLYGQIAAGISGKKMAGGY